mgnify:FL=1
MIELLTFLGFNILHILFKYTQDTYVYVMTMNSLISLLCVFVIFARVFLKIGLDKFWKAEKRYFLLSLFYLALLLEGCLAVMFFGGDLERPYGAWPYIKLGSQILMYGLSVVMFVAAKRMDFKHTPIYGKAYFWFNIIDCVMLISLLVSDYLITPELLIKDKYIIPFVDIWLFILAFVNIWILHFRKFWQHKSTLLKMFDNLVKTRTEEKLIKPEMRDLSTDNIWKEIVIVLDQAPIRVVQLDVLLIQLHEIMIKNGRKPKDVTNFIADFAAVIIKNLMKRKWDFSCMPSFVVNFKQKHDKPKKGSDNKRGLLK